MKKHYETYVEDTDKLISVAGPVLDYKSWYEQYRKLMEEQAQRKYGLYTPTSEGDDDFPSISGMIARYSALGLTNEQMTANPVWKDLTGNGHDLQMKNFAWKGMSGVGGYTENYDSNKWYKVASRIDTTWTYKSFNVKSIKYNNSAQLFYQSLSSDTGFRVLSCTIKVSGLTDGQGIEYVSNGAQPTVIMRIENDGIYHLPSFDFGAKNAYYGFRFLKLQESCNITIEQLPLYPGALVFDGVDDYGTCDNFPILTKEKGYTVVALRQWITRGEIASGLVSNVKDWFNDGAFLLEYRNVNADYFNSPMSFGAIGSEKDLPHILTYQTSKSYNGVSIITGNFTGTDVLYAGKLATRNVGICINAAIWELVFLDHDATEEELTKIKDYFVKTYPWLFPDQAWTVTGKTNEDKDRATIANITGNGNDLRLSNFGFAEGSGYGDYPFKPSASLSEGQPYGTLHFKTDGLYSNLVKSNVNSIQIKFNLRDMPEGGILSVRALDINTALVIKGESYTTDGSYEFVYDDPSKPVNIVFYNGTSSTGQFNFYVDIIPEYEGYLVTDGVDDTGRAVNLTISKDFTLVGEWILFSKTSVNAGLPIHPQIHIFNRPEAIQITFRTAGKTLPVKSLKVICSDGRCYDENWNEFKINVGEFISSNGVLYVASNGTYHAQIAFKNLGIYNDQIFSKDDCIKAYNYLQTLKAK